MEEKKVEKITVESLQEQVNGLCAEVRRHSKNWVRFYQRHVGSVSDPSAEKPGEVTEGRINIAMLMFMGLLSLGTIAFGAGEKGNWSEGTGTLRFNQTDRTGDIELEVDDLLILDDFIVTDDVSITGNVAIVGALDVTGDATLTGDIAVNGDDITSDGDLTITPAGGDMTLASDVVVSSNLTVTLDIDIDGNDLTSAADLTITPGGGDMTIDADLTVSSNLVVTLDVDIDGGDITCPVDLTITPTGVDVLLVGGLTVGSTTEAGDNNLRVEGTSALVGDITATGDIAVNGDDVTSDGDLTVTPAGGDMTIDADLTVSSNLVVTLDIDIDGNDLTSADDLTITPAGGDATIDADLTVSSNLVVTLDVDIDGGDITCPAALTITPTGTNVLIDGGLTVGSTTSPGDNNLRVEGTSALVGAVTVTGDVAVNGDNITSDGNLTITSATGTNTLGTNVVILGDVWVQGGDIRSISTAELTITPGATNAHLDGGWTIGSTTDAGDNNLRVEGTAALVGAVTCTDDIAVNGDDITSDGNLTITSATGTNTLGTNVVILGDVWVQGGDIRSISTAELTITPGATNAHLDGGFTIGSTTDAGDDNLRVEGTSALVGDITATGDIAINGDDITCDGNLAITAATGGVTLNTNVTITGGLTLKYANETGNYSVLSGDYLLSFDTSAATTCTLAEASSVLGEEFVIVLQDDDGDLEVRTDGTDKFDGTNDILTFTNANEGCTVVATAANVYTIKNRYGGTASN